MPPSSLVTGTLLQTVESLPITLQIICCDLSSRFLAKGRVGNGYRFIARNGLVVLAADAPLAELAGHAAEARLQVWHRAILPGDQPQAYGLLLCVRKKCSARGRPIYRAALAVAAGSDCELALAVGGSRWLEFTRESGVTPRDD